MWNYGGITMTTIKDLFKDLAIEVRDAQSNSETLLTDEEIEDIVSEYTLQVKERIVG